MKRACIKGCTDVKQPCWAIVNGVYQCGHRRSAEWHIDDEDTHLCNACKHTYPECVAKPSDVIYGTGVGNDNVVRCKRFESEVGIQVTTLQAGSAVELNQKLAKGLNDGWEIIGDIRTVALPNCRPPIIHYVTLRKESWND